MTFYSNLAATAARLLTKYGRSMTLRQAGAATYNPATGQNTASTTDTTCHGALLDFTDGQTTHAGSLIEVGDKRLLLESSVQPKLENLVIIGGTPWVVKGLKEINPGGTVVLYDARVRK